MTDTPIPPAAPNGGPEPRLEQRAVSSLIPYKRNARTHSKAQIGKIARSIRELGFNNPILVDEKNVILAGHGRLAAAKQLGLESVPVLCLAGMTEAQKRAYIIADNRTAEEAGWDKRTLALELQELSIEAPELDLEVTGFETPQIDIMIGDLDKRDEDKADTITESVPDKPVSQLGDLWLLGPHRLICGDSTKPETYTQLMGGKKAQMVFTDPPYNVRVADISGLGKTKHAEFAMASGEMTEEQFTAFLHSVFEQLAANSMDGSLHFVCMDWRHLFELLSAARPVYSEIKNLLVWNKTNAGMGSLYRSRHELIYLFKNGTAPHINNVELGRHGKYRTNVLTYAGATVVGKARNEDLALHPTPKPIGMVQDLIEDCSKRGQVILDAFSGSGTTLIAAERAGRHGYAVELDAGYVDVAVERYQRTFGIDAVHAESGETFAAVAEKRRG